MIDFDRFVICTIFFINIAKYANILNLITIWTTINKYFILQPTS